MGLMESNIHNLKYEIEEEACHCARIKVIGVGGVTQGGEDYAAGGDSEQD